MLGGECVYQPHIFFSMSYDYNELRFLRVKKGKEAYAQQCVPETRLNLKNGTPSCIAVGVEHNGLKIIKSKALNIICK